MTIRVHLHHLLELVEASHDLMVGHGCKEAPLAHEHEVHVAHGHLCEDLPARFAGH